MKERERRRVADALADAGVGARRVAIELLYLLPDSFVSEYERLYHEAFTLGDEGKGARDEKQAALGKAKGKGSSKGSGKGSSKGSVDPIRSEKALEQKAWVDRQLRKLARTMKAGDRTDEGRYKCGQRTEKARKEKRGCGKWNEKNWIYCPFCGYQNRLVNSNREGNRMMTGSGNEKT